MTIVEFLNARLDEDERASKAAPEGARGRDRALAEVAAKRGILRGYVEAHRAGMRALEPMLAAGPPAGRPRLRGADRGGDPWSELLAWRLAVKYLAAVYRTHPEYDHSWGG
ncbi:MULTISPECIES: DUF6221 family protein [unclassified Nocardiopsis]|uniref:DUF6221 family protein n=1 Tax=unclassified Nocardiopsis TaxID=2649073 RepID=UPI00135697FB|nr:MULTISPECIES: DUF6221 family protein [unclassified Nocardiopsis]